MKLGDLATRNVVYVAPEDSVSQAILIMEKHGIHHLPVLAAGRIVGMVSDRDLLMVGAGQEETGKKDAKKTAARSPRVEDIMSQPVFSLSPDDYLRSATWLMVTQRVHAVPLVRRDRLVGLVTETDLLRGVVSSYEFSHQDEKAFLREPVTTHVQGRTTTVGPRTSLDDAVEIMCKKQIRHLPVVVDDTLLGIVSDRDIRRVLGKAATLDAQAQESGEFYMGPSEVCEIMTRSVQTVTPSTNIETAIDELLRQSIHCLPIVEDGKLLGVITDTDILRAIGAADEKDASSDR